MDMIEFFYIYFTLFMYVNNHALFAGKKDLFMSLKKNGVIINMVQAIDLVLVV